MSACSNPNWASCMALLDDNPSLVPTLCWNEEVVNGAGGLRVYGFSFTSATMNPMLFSSPRIPSMLSSFRISFLSDLRFPCGSKSDPVAIGCPSHFVKVASTCSPSTVKLAWMLE